MLQVFPFSLLIGFAVVGLSARSAVAAQLPAEPAVTPTLQVDAKVTVGQSEGSLPLLEEAGVSREAIVRAESSQTGEEAALPHRDVDEPTGLEEAFGRFVYEDQMRNGGEEEEEVEEEELFPQAFKEGLSLRLMNAVVTWAAEASNLDGFAKRRCALEAEGVAAVEAVKTYLEKGV
ncbi:hypothetical protein Efla_005749 [Eimeria flavescens]